MILGMMTLLLFSGCGEATDDARASSYSVEGTFNGGNDALTIEFTPGQPPEEIVDGGQNPFDVRLLIKNEGETDVLAGTAYAVLSGINPIDFDISDVSAEIQNLNGVKGQGTRKINGQLGYVAFTQLKYLPELPGSSSQKISVDMCYPYETRSVIKGCVSGETFRVTNDDLDICELDEVKEFSNSGAPVQIENVKQFPSGSSSIQIQFDIIDKSVSQNGRVFRENSFDSNCKVAGDSVSSTQASLNRDYVTYSFDSKGLPVDCNGGTNTGEAFLVNSKATVSCTIDTTGEQDYEQIFGVTLNYDYFDRIDTEILINHIPR